VFDNFVPGFFLRCVVASFRSELAFTELATVPTPKIAAAVLAPSLTASVPSIAPPEANENDTYQKTLV